MDDEPVLWCKDLRKRFKERLAVDGVGFEVAPGETYGLLGPNGAGKTTTISMICGLLRRDGGEVTVAGASLDRDPGQVKAAIGYVPQDVALYPDLSGLENLRFWGRMYGLAGRDLAERVEATLEVVGLAERAGDKVADYSGGMQRRLNIAAGLLHRPRLLVLDEPTAGVDPQSRNAILGNVEALGGEGDRRALHHPLHGGGRAALRPGRDHRPGPPGRRGHPARAGAPGSGSATASSWPPPATWPGWPRRPPASTGSTRPAWSPAASTWSPGTVAGCCRGCWRRPSTPGPR